LHVYLLIRVCPVQTVDSVAYRVEILFLGRTVLEHIIKRRTTVTFDFTGGCCFITRLIHSTQCSTTVNWTLEYKDKEFRDSSKNIMDFEKYNAFR